MELVAKWVRLASPRQAFGGRDYVLVYEIKKHDAQATGVHSHRLNSERNSFIEGMEKLGLDVEKTKAIQKSGHVTFFIKIHIPWRVMEDWAEKLHTRAPLQEAPGIVIVNWTQKVLDRLHCSRLNVMEKTVPSLPPHYYTAPFRADKLEHYVFKEDPQKLFSRPQRSYIADEMLQSVVYGDEGKAQVGLTRLLQENVFQAAFPLHDGPLREEMHQSGDTNNTNIGHHQRQILRDYWASFPHLHRYQPIGHIRSYFGEQITLYFAWLGHYTVWLIPLSLIGLAVSIYGLVTLAYDPLVEEVCYRGHHYTMCPICDECPFWTLSQACRAYQADYLFDNYGTCLHAFAVSIWVMMVDFWKRKNEELTHFFDCEDYQEENEHPRAAFTRRAPLMRRNMVTGLLEPYVPATTLLIRRLTSWAASISFVLLIFLVTFGVILLRTRLKTDLIHKYGMSSPHAIAAGPIATLVNLVTILTLNYIYVIVANRLTEWEMYRTQREHEESLAWKAYWFQFVNVFAPMFYLAFIKGRFTGWPGHYRRVADMMLETCDIGGCFAELGVQLIITMFGKQIVCKLAEFYVPMVERMARGRRGKLRADTEMNARFLDQQYKLLAYTGLTGEYMETVIQFGFIVLFGAAFPLGAFISLLNNIVEIRIDAHKLVVNSRRPLARRARSIGIWLHVLRWMTVLSVWTNAFLMAFTSDTLAEMLYSSVHAGSLVGFINSSLATAAQGGCRYESLRNRGGDLSIVYYELTVLRLTFVLCYVAAVYGICTLISALIPDIPKEILDARNRRLFLATQALQSTPAAASEAYQKVRTSTQDNPLALKRQHQRQPRNKIKVSNPSSHSPSPEMEMEMEMLLSADEFHDIPMRPFSKRS